MLRGLTGCRCRRARCQSPAACGCSGGGGRRRRWHTTTHGVILLLIATADDDDEKRKRERKRGRRLTNAYFSSLPFLHITTKIPLVIL